MQQTSSSVGQEDRPATSQQPREKTYVSVNYSRQRLTKEMLQEVEESFNMIADPTNKTIPYDKIPLLMNALGLGEFDEELAELVDPMSRKENILIEQFLQIVCCVTEKGPNWAYSEMVEAYRVFDKDDRGFLDPMELKRVFIKLGETLQESDFVQQIQEFDIDGDHQMQLAEWFMMISSTKGSDYIFDD